MPWDRQEKSIVADFTVVEGQSVDFALTSSASCLPPPAPFDIGAEIGRTEAFWLDWAGRCVYQGRWRPQVLRSLLTLKGLTYAPTGGIIAALTTSLPEQLGGPRNWDYRYCWLRDATLTLIALMRGGYTMEAQAWRNWLHRAVAGYLDTMQSMYGISGEKQLVE